MTKIHASIRKDPKHLKAERKGKPKRDHAKKRNIRLTVAQRKAKVQMHFAEVAK